MKVLILVVSLMILTACNSNELLITGIYTSRKSPDIITLFLDSTFKYEQTLVPGSRFVERSSSGTWKLDRNSGHIILNSAIQDLETSIEADVIPARSTKSIVLVNLKVDSEPIENYICYPILNREIYQQNVERGAYSFKTDKQIDRISFQIVKQPKSVEVLGMKQPTYNTIKTKEVELSCNVGDSVLIDIQLSDSLFSYKLFNDEKLRYEKNRLFFLNQKLKVSL